MSPDDRYDDFDELLRSALRDEADTVTPAGDGLARIQQRVQQRDVRTRWLRPALALGSAAVLAGLGVGAAILVNNSGDDTVSVGQGGHRSSEPSQTTTPQPIANKQFPAQGIFPFTDATAEQGWEQDYANGGTTWEADPTQVATHWVQNYLDQPSVDRVISTADDNGDKVVTLGRVLQGEGNNLFAVTAVRLTSYGNAWIVTGASDPNNYMSISSPLPGSTIVTPATVTGPGFGVDEGLRLDVRDATSATSYGTATLTVGNGINQWRQPVNFNRPNSPVGVLVAVDSSNADGGPARIVAEQVQFSPAAPNRPPPYFYAVKNNRITKFASRTGQSIQYLTSAQPGGGLQDPKVYGSDVYYIQGAGTCANVLMKVPASADGSANGDSVASPDNGYIITAYAVGETSIATFETTCDPARSPQARLVTTPQSGGAKTHVIDFPSLPPTLIGDPSFEVAGAKQLMAAIVRGGTQNSLTNYDVYGDTDPQPSRPACSGLGPEDGQPNAIEVDGNGDLWVALQTGSSMDVVRCGANGKPKTEFTIPGNDQPADIDVTSDGSAVLLTDDNGKVWRWDGSGNPTELAAVPLPLTQVSW
jgi:hypothetical protein